MAVLFGHSRNNPSMLEIERSDTESQPEKVLARVKPDYKAFLRSEIFTSPPEKRQAERAESHFPSSFLSRVNLRVSEHRSAKQTPPAEVRAPGNGARSLPRSKKPLPDQCHFGSWMSTATDPRTLAWLSHKNSEARETRRELRKHRRRLMTAERTIQEEKRKREKIAEEHFQGWLKKKNEERRQEKAVGLLAATGKTENRTAPEGASDPPTPNCSTRRLTYKV